MILAQSIIIGIFLFATGFVCGWYAKKQMSSNQASEDRMRLFISLFITLIWGVSIAAEILIPEYQTNYLVHALMGAVAGLFFKKSKFTEVLKR